MTNLNRLAATDLVGPHDASRGDDFPGYAGRALRVATFITAIALVGCSGTSGDVAAGDQDVRPPDSQTSQPSGREPGGDDAGDSGEESGTQLALGDTYDEIRGGAQLVLTYDSGANAFTGTVTNTTAATLDRVRVEVHLSNGTELGPTTPMDLAPGQVHDVTLEATEASFSGWSAHAEVGNEEHGGESGENGEHDESGERGGEHDESGERGDEHGGREGRER